MTDNTLLVLMGIGIPPYSARGLTQTLDPIDQSKNLRRAINGSLIDFSAPQFRLYKSTITGSDQQPPAIDGVWPGAEVTVDCIARLAYPEYGVPTRTVVEDSVQEEGGFVFYRPRLLMTVVNFATSHDEWQAIVGWSMELEEKL